MAFHRNPKPLFAVAVLRQTCNLVKRLDCWRQRTLERGQRCRGLRNRHEPLMLELGDAESCLERISALMVRSNQFVKPAIFVGEVQEGFDRRAQNSDDLLLQPCQCVQFGSNWVFVSEVVGIDSSRARSQDYGVLPRCRAQTPVLVHRSGVSTWSSQDSVDR